MWSLTLVALAALAALVGWAVYAAVVAGWAVPHHARWRTDAPLQGGVEVVPFAAPAGAVPWSARAFNWAVARHPGTGALWGALRVSNHHGGWPLAMAKRWTWNATWVGPLTAAATAFRAADVVNLGDVGEDARLVFSASGDAWRLLTHDPATRGMVWHDPRPSPPRRWPLPVRAASGVEKNWGAFPLPTGDGWALTYRVEPHEVLRWHEAAGTCAVAWRSSCDALREYLGPDTVLCNSSCTVADGPRGRVGLAHVRLEPGHVYLHLLYWLDSAPPFAVRAFTRLWRLPPQTSRWTLPYVTRQHVQYGMGAVPTADGYLLSWAEQDRAAFVARVPRAAVLRLLHHRQG